MIGCCDTILSAKIIESNHFRRNAIVVKHLGYCSGHHWRTTEVIFDFFRFLMILQIIVLYNFVNETYIAVPIVLRFWFRQGNIEREVRIFGFYLLEIGFVENFAARPCPIPERNLARSMQSLEQMEDMRPHWSQPAPVFLPGKSHGQRSLVSYSPWSCKSQT